MTTYKARQLADWDYLKEVSPGVWIPARPSDYRHRSFFKRLREAWLVFTGQLDSLDWENDVQVTGPEYECPRCLGVGWSMEESAYSSTCPACNGMGVIRREEP